MSKTVRCIWENGICVSCGVCKAVCPCDAIEYTRENGIYRPLINEEKCTNCGICYELCGSRGINLEAQYKDKTNNISEYECYFGKSVECLISETKDERILRNATSGGVVTTLVKLLLQDNIYDVAFCVNTYNYSNAVETKPIFKDDSINEIPKSRYVPVLQTQAIEYILNNRDKKVILIGVSCFVHSIIKMIEHYRLNRDNYLIIGLFCDKNMNYNIYNYFDEKCDKDLDKLYFRTKESGGYPGNMRLQFADGTYVDLQATERMKVKDFYQLERCMYCVDKLNQCSDISVGDNYTDEHNSNLGTSCIIIRSECGREIWNRYTNDFNSWRIEKDKIWNSQNLDERKKNYYFLKIKESNDIIVPFTNYTNDNWDNYKLEYQKKIESINLGRKNEIGNINKILKKRESIYRKRILSIKYFMYEIKKKMKSKFSI